MSYQKKLGKWGESLAEQYLIDLGVDIFLRNVYTPYGELDLIGKDHDTVIFFEVKTRTTHTFGNPEDSINQRKKKHLTESALYFMQSHPEEQGDWRIDVISIQKDGEQNNPYRIEWFKNAIQ